tara:strand:+ start:395 stop:1090 length:696 start_codon:yes stop_codon:yes gene_type:complete
MDFKRLVNQVISERDYGIYKRTPFMHRLRIYFAFNKIFNKESYDGLSILDIGSNEGTYSVLFKEKGFEVDGLDICDLSKAKQLSAKYNLDVKYYSMSIESAELPKTYDYIFCSEVLEHVNDINKALISIKNLSYKHTKIIISLPNVISLYGILRLLRDIIIYKFDFSKIDPHQQFPPWYVKSLFNKHGFKIKVLGSVNFTPFNIFPKFNLFLSDLSIFKMLGYSTFYYVYY